MEWDVFGQVLAEELVKLPAGALLVISESGEPKQSRYVQFAQSPSELTAYVVVNSFLKEPARASVKGERTIVAAGWHPPEPSAGHDNWWRTLTWPATAEQYRMLAGMVVTALRDGYGLLDPGALRYQAWNEDTGVDIELPRLGLAAG